MSTITRQPWRGSPYEQLRGEMDRLFSTFFGEGDPGLGWRPSRVRAFPALNVWEDGDSLFLEAEAPGLAHDDVELTVSGTELSIRGSRPETRTREGSVVHQRERRFGGFHRVVHLPVPVDGEAIEATMQEGILHVKLPKSEACRTRRIEVTTPTS